MSNGHSATAPSVPPGASVAIIGGGITGLCAAWQLRRQGVPVTVYEAADRTGGVIRSLRQGPYLAEYGPNTLLETSQRIKGLIEDLGLASRRNYSDPAAKARYVVRYGKPIDLPSGPLSFALTKLFTWPAKIRLFGVPFPPRGQGPDESVASFVTRRLGPEFLNYAVDPMVNGVYAGDPSRLSIRHAFPKIHVLEAQHGSLVKGTFMSARARRKKGEIPKTSAPKVSFDHGLQVLPDALAQQLGESVELNSRVTALAAQPDGHWQVTVAKNGRETTRRHRFVLYTSPAYHIRNLRIQAPQAVDLSPLGEIYYPPVASVVLAFRQADIPHPIDGFGMLVPKLENFKILGSVFNSALFPGRAPAGEVLLTTYLGGAKNPSLAGESEDRLVEHTCQDLRTILGLRGKPTFRHLSIYPKAIPQYEVGYQRFKDLMDQAEQAMPGFYLAGHFRHGISLSDSIHAGLDTGLRLAQAWKTGTP
jgi:oxygen-dependent protoporphyrinogen oxidase